jgi:hypothetical protein
MGSGPHLMPLHASTSPTRLPMHGRCRLGCLQLGKMGARTHSACGSGWAVLGRTLDLED